MKLNFPLLMAVAAAFFSVFVGIYSIFTNGFTTKTAILVAFGATLVLFALYLMVVPVSETASDSNRV